MGKTEFLAEIAEEYLFSGLVAHDPSKVPLAPNAVRTENGRNTGQGADDIGEKLKAWYMRMITGIRNLRWFIIGDQEAIAFFELDTTRSPDPTLIAERFRVVDGLITEIEAIFHIPENSRPLSEMQAELDVD